MRVSAEEHVTGTSARFAPITGPADLADLGSPFGYGWYRISIKSGDGKKHKVLAPSSRDRLRFFLDGEEQGIMGFGPGADHEPMALTLMSNEDVALAAEYVAGLPPVQPTPSLDGDAEKGKALYGACAACHQAEGTGNEAMGAPPLINTHDWYLVTQLTKFKGGVRGAKDSWGASMAPMTAGLPDEQAMKDVVAYIQTLRK